MEKENKSVIPFKLHEGYKAGESEVIKFIDINSLKESKTNPRKVYDDKALNDLADSIKIKGIVQNLVVRKVETVNHEGFEIVAGSRRFRAAKIAGLKAVPCVIRTYTDGEVLEIQVIENNQREDVHPLEEGEGYAALLKLEGYTVEAIAAKIGRSDKYVRERLQLAKLHPKVKEHYQKGNLWYTHCRLLSRLTVDQQEAALREIWTNGFYGREEKHPVSVKSLETWIEQNVEKSLGSASFPLTDATINKQAGACVSCQFNTATDMQLFPDYATSNKKGVCLKPECFKQKVKAYADRQVKEKLKADEKSEMLLVSERNYSNVCKDINGRERIVIGWNNFDKVKKTDKGSLEAVLVGARDTEDKGKTIWVKLKNDKDKKPSGKSENRGMASVKREPELSPEEKAEIERKENHKKGLVYHSWGMFIKMATAKQMKSLNKKILLSALKKAVDNELNWDFMMIVSGVNHKTGKDLEWNKRIKVWNEFIEKKSIEELYALLVVSHAADGNKFTESCKIFGIDPKVCHEHGVKIADEMYPDPSKQLIVTFAGMKYNIKENDYLSELQAISQLLRKYIEKEKPQEMKSMNLINPGAGQPNVFFRKDAKTGLYKFSEWIDKDGTAMGFDRMTKDKFIKCIKGFKAVTKSEVKKK